MDTMKELVKCKNVRLLGMWTDPEGVYGSIPIFELDELPCEEWNKLARKKAQKIEMETLP